MTSLVVYLVVLLLFSAGTFLHGRVVKQSLLLAASYLFYATWGIGFLVVLVASSVINFVLGAWLRHKPTTARLWAGIVINVSLLSFFKYLPVLASGDFFQRIVMPVGMSFWTFQALSYLFDIYREEEVAPSLLEFCLYMGLWPTVVMGPVCRLPNLLPQFRETAGFSRDDVSAGLHRIGTGLFMKLILAQLLGSALSAGSEFGGGFDEIGRNWGGLDVWLLAIGFGFQLFFDFAGYSHIVIGTARLFGLRLAENFDSPYLSSTPSVFWTKWHMSLSSWIRDYVFIPAATVRRGTSWRYFVLLVSMVLFGLWHGGRVTFILWGAYHGVFLVLHRSFQQLQRRFNLNLNHNLGGLLSWLVTFLGISLGWVLFRANDLRQAVAMFGAIFSPATYLQMKLPGSYYRLLLALVSGYFAYNLVIESDYLANIKERLFATGDRSNSDVVPRFVRFCWVNRVWWLAPMIGTLIVFAGLMVLFQSSGVTPFIYTLF